jgi:hypothetical protein
VPLAATRSTTRRWLLATTSGTSGTTALLRYQLAANANWLTICLSSAIFFDSQCS